jgi:hypothetical protein
MKKNIAVKLVCISFCLAFPAIAAAQSAPPPASKAESGVARELLGELWGKLRSYGPKLQANSAGKQYVTVTVGIRGNENTASELKPYWKDDRADDPAFINEAKAYRAAHEMAEKNRSREAIQALESFMKTYPNSLFKPNAQFAIGLSHTALGEKAQAAAALKTFAKEYPKHPLAADANRAVEQLKF